MAGLVQAVAKDPVARADIKDLEDKVHKLEETVAYLEKDNQEIRTEMKLMVARTIGLVKLGPRS